MNDISGELLLFRTMWNSSSDNMFIVRLGENGEFISESCNRSQEITFGLSPHQVDELSLKEILDEQTYNSIADKYNHCISLNKPITYEESVIIDDTGERYFNTTILPVIDDAGTVKIFGISREFTELKNISKELQRVNETLELKVQERTKELLASLEEIKRISILDNMTGLYNRMKIDKSLEYEIKRASRNDEVFGLILLDIDLFKNINDTYSHQVGDGVLIEFANLLKSNVREVDIVGRWGGEEFMIICPSTDLEGTYAFAQSLRMKIENFHFTIVEDITASFGVTIYKSQDTSASITKRADDAMYKAKDSRNFVFCLS